MRPRRFLLLAVLTLVASAAGAQVADPMAALAPQGEDASVSPPAHVTSPTDTFDAARTLIRLHPGTRAAELSALGVFEERRLSLEQKGEIARLYVETYARHRLDGPYLEYALGLWATAEKDSARQLELAGRYLRTYPDGTYRQYVKPIAVARRVERVGSKLREGNIREGFAYGEELWAERHDADLAYQMAAYAHGDLVVHGHASPLLHEAVKWAQRGIDLLEGGPSVNSHEAWDGGAEKRLLETLYEMKEYAEALTRRHEGGSGLR